MLLSSLFIKLSFFLQTVKFRKVKVRLNSPTRCPPLACNVVAAWRQAGASAKFGREQRMMLPALCQTRLHPRLRQTARCVKCFF